MPDVGIRFSFAQKGRGRGLPRQCAHCLAMTGLFYIQRRFLCSAQRSLDKHCHSEEGECPTWESVSLYAKGKGDADCHDQFVNWSRNDRVILHSAPIFKFAAVQFRQALSFRGGAQPRRGNPFSLYAKGTGDADCHDQSEDWSRNDRADFTPPTATKALHICPAVIIIHFCPQPTFSDIRSKHETSFRLHPP